MLNRLSSIICFCVVLYAVVHSGHAEWVQTNGPFGGCIAAMAVNGNTTYIGTVGGYVYRSTNNGDSWFKFSNGLGPYEIRTFSANGRMVYVGTAGDGVYRLGKTIAAGFIVRARQPMLRRSVHLALPFCLAGRTVFFDPAITGKRGCKLFRAIIFHGSTNAGTSF